VEIDEFESTHDFEKGFGNAWRLTARFRWQKLAKI
jgi:hypothetical protein